MTRDVDDVLPARLRFVRHTDGEALSIVNFNDGTLMKKPGVLPVLPMKKRLGSRNMVHHRFEENWGLGVSPTFGQLKGRRFVGMVYRICVNSPQKAPKKMP